jgi:type IV fimbrial biogenesis protein FimT
VTQRGSARKIRNTLIYITLPREAFNMLQRNGFSLVETMATLSIVSTLAAVGLPNLNGLVQERAAQAGSEAFRSAVRLARNEAVRRGETLTLCARDPKGGDASQTCAPRGTDWSAGWLLFIDRGERGVVEAGDRILRVHQPGAAAGQVLGSTGRLSFQPTGISFNAASNFRFVPPGQAADDDRVVLLCLNKSGRARVSETAAACSA